MTWMFVESDWPVATTVFTGGVAEGMVTEKAVRPAPALPAKLPVNERVLEAVPEPNVPVLVAVPKARVDEAVRPLAAVWACMYARTAV